jgi:hypothetical protein
MMTEQWSTSLDSHNVPTNGRACVGDLVAQDVILNVCLTAITMLWSVTDSLARSKRAVPGAVPGGKDTVLEARPAWACSPH